MSEEIPVIMCSPQRAFRLLVIAATALLATMAGCALQGSIPTPPPLPPTWTASHRSPTVARIEVPEVPGSNAIYGAVGRDDRGHLWFGVSSKGVETPSAHVFEFDPATGKLTDRGDVVTAMKGCGVYRPDDQQMKIHSRIVQAADGHMYFASMDEEGESVQPEGLPTWGGHLWRLRLPEYKWEHLIAAPEALIAVAEGGRWVYALGYWGHKLYQYDSKTGKVRSVKVGAFGGHISRNLFADRRGHVYVPRVKPGAEPGSAVATLVEYDPNLREVGQRPLAHYIESTPAKSQGITGFVELPDGSTAFLTQYGHLALVRPSSSGPATVTDLGWFHPRGSAYTHSLFTDATGRYLIGAARKNDRYEWVVYDLQTRSSRAFPFRMGSGRRRGRRRRDLYGTAVRDDAGNCYLVGGDRGGVPLILQVRP